MMANERQMLIFGVIFVLIFGGGIWLLMKEEATWDNAPLVYTHSNFKTVDDKEYERDVRVEIKTDSEGRITSTTHVDEDWYLYFDDGSYRSVWESEYRARRIGDVLETKYFTQTREDGKTRTRTQKEWHR